jgi:hypothetical protein
MQGSHKIFSEGPLQDHARTPSRISQGSSQNIIRFSPTASTRHKATRGLHEHMLEFHPLLHGLGACHAKWAGFKSDNSFTKRVEETKLWSTLCENLRGRNGYGHFTRELLREPAQAKAGGHNRKNPSAWTHLLGKNHPRVVGYYCFCAWFFTKLI